MAGSSGWPSSTSASSRRSTVGRRPLPLHRGAAGPALARLADPARDRRYLDGRTYLRLKESAEIDNPDQRIAEDIRAFTTTTLSFTLIFLNATLAAISFSGVLWTISPLLFGVAVGYAALGTLTTVLLGRPLVGLNYRQSDREADFRADLIHVRENAESVALLRREGRLRARLLQPDRRAGGELPAHHRR